MTTQLEYARQGIGTGLRTKVNASIGTSSDICDIDLEVQKANAAEEEGADTLMELSADGDLDLVRRTVLANTRLPVGNVPLYQAFKETIRKYQNPAKLDPEYLFELIERQLEDGLSFMAIHDSHDRAQMAEMIINCELAEIGRQNKRKPAPCAGIFVP